MSRWLKEPLLHFLLLGLAIFGAYRVLGPDEPPPATIVVTEGIIDGQIESFSRTWLRPPTPQELDGLIREYVREEVYYREGMALGLDRDDTVIRRRLRQKMEFISEGVADSVEPTDSQLQAFLEQHAEKFIEPARLTFQQVFLSPDQRGEAVERDAERLLAELVAARSGRL